MTYIFLNSVFILIGVAIWLYAHRRDSKRMHIRQSLFLLIPLMIMSILFDNILTSLPIVTYDANKLLGLYIGTAPIEDFAYTLVLVFLVPAIWRLLDEK